MKGEDIRVYYARRTPSGVVVVPPAPNAPLSNRIELVDLIESIDKTITVVDDVIYPDSPIDGNYSGGYSYKPQGVIKYEGLKFTYSRRGGMTSCSFNTFNTLTKDDFILIYNRATLIFYGSVRDVSNKPIDSNGVVYNQTVECGNLFLGDFYLPRDSNFAPTRGLPLAFVLSVVRDILIDAGIDNSIIDFDTTSQENIKLEVGGSLFEFFDNLSNELSTPYCWGVSPGKIYFKKVSATPFIISNSSKSILSYSKRGSNQRVFSRVTYTGGQAKYPQKIINGSFETYNWADALTVTSYNELPYSLSSFETGWAFANGASRKIKGGTGNDEVKPRTGSYVLEIDSPNESATQRFESFDILPGAGYTFSFWYQPEPLISTTNPLVVKCLVRWIDAGGSVIFADQFFSERNTTSVWFNSQTIFFAPTGAAKVEIVFVYSSGDWGTNRGVHIDDVVMFKSANLYPDSWKVRQIGTGKFAYCHVELGAAPHGMARMFIESNSCNDANRVMIDSNEMQVLPGEAYKMFARLKAVPTKTFPTLYFVVRAYKLDPTPSNPPILIDTVQSLGPYITDTKWHHTELYYRVPRDTAFITLAIEQASVGAFYIDAVSCRDMRELAGDYYDNTVSFDVDVDQLDAYATFGEPTTFGNDLVARYGAGRTEVVQGTAEVIIGVDNLEARGLPYGLNEVIAYVKANGMFDDVPDIKYHGDLLDITKPIYIDGKYILEEVTVDVKPMCIQEVTLAYPKPKVEAIARLMSTPNKNVRS